MRDEALELYRLAAPDYEYQDGIWATDPPRVARLKRALAELPEDDRRLLVLYAETGSFRKCGELMGYSYTWVWRRYTAARAALLDKLK